MSEEQGLATVVELLRASGDEFATAIYDNLFCISPIFSQRVPAHRDRLNKQIRRALLHVYSQQASGRGLDRTTRRFLRHLAEDHRSFGIESEDYDAMGNAVMAAVRQVVAGRVSDQDLELFAMANAQLFGIMADAAEKARDVQVRWVAEVTEVERRSDSIAVVRLTVDEPLPYVAGQFVPVLAPQSLGRRYPLSPAIPPSPDGLLEFHIAIGAIGDDVLTGDLVRMTRPGDLWELGRPRGPLSTALLRSGASGSSGPDATDTAPSAQSGETESAAPARALLVGYSTGLAPLRAMVLELAGAQDRPEIDLFFGGDYPADLYELRTLWSLSQAMPWLTLHPWTKFEDNPRFSRVTGHSVAPQSLEIASGKPFVSEVMDSGLWADREIIIAGPPQVVTALKEELVERGVSRDRIHHDPLPR